MYVLFKISLVVSGSTDQLHSADVGLLSGNCAQKDWTLSSAYTMDWAVLSAERLRSFATNLLCKQGRRNKISVANICFTIAHVPKLVADKFYAISHLERMPFESDDRKSSQSLYSNPVIGLSACQCSRHKCVCVGLIRRVRGFVCRCASVPSYLCDMRSDRNA